MRRNGRRGTRRPHGIISEGAWRRGARNNRAYILMRDLGPEIVERIFRGIPFLKKRMLGGENDGGIDYPEHLIDHPTKES